MSPGPIRLLVVEDNLADVRLVQEMLAEADAARFRIIHADSLAKALKALSEQEIHVIHQNHSLPDSFGLETLVRVRSAAPRQPNENQTKQQNEALALQAVQMGAQD